MSTKPKREPTSPKHGEMDEGEDLVLDFVEEAGDELEESDRIQSPRTLSAPHSPDAGEEALHAEVEEDLNGNERKLNNNKQVGPRTPPGSDDDKYDRQSESSTDLNESRGRKRRSSRSSSSDGGDSSRSRSSLSRRSSNSSDLDRSPPQKYRQMRKRDRDEDDDTYLSVAERLRQNKRARITRLRDARSRHLGYQYVPRLGGKPGFPPQPYFKNPSYYPDTHRDKSKPPNPPPLAQKIDPLPGGRLPVVQRRSSPAPFDNGSSGRHSPSYRSAAPKRRRGIVEDVFTVRASGR
ncbi:hypothetical protein Mgra_00003365 [Meloidogyne graminicola]|uniref:Uncharacterized protein n=1 Tax=Meloidogyne graminicola TaxID=189291 RepID=A0A8S9ZU12_9BILA|nr:hypothetical protein Mgra_00003365 [Meloidogyne graminicola]